MITLFGNNIGPTTPVVLTDANQDGYADTSIASTSVTVDGIAAPLIYASQNQITIQVPYEATLGVGKVIAVNQGANPPSTANVTIGVNAPGLFTADGSGAGQLAALNFSAATSLYSVNSSTNAAPYKTRSIEISRSNVNPSASAQPTLHARTLTHGTPFVQRLASTRGRRPSSAIA